jgi:thiol:disulfide interchange protein DsbD
VVWLAWVFSLQVGLAGPASDKEVWQPFSDARVAELRAQSKPVFIDFTAAWCVTCQVNKQLVLSRPETLRAFRDKGVTLLRADWTRQDPEITRALAALGRNGVPVYVLYRPGRDALLLPEILTGDALRSALAEL